MLNDSSDSKVNIQSLFLIPSRRSSPLPYVLLPRTSVLWECGFPLISTYTAAYVYEYAAYAAPVFVHDCSAALKIISHFTLTHVYLCYLKIPSDFKSLHWNGGQEANSSAGRYGALKLYLTCFPTCG